MSRARDAGASPRAAGPAARNRSLRHDRSRIVVRKKRRHVELAGLQIISAAPVIHHAGLHGLAGLDIGVPRKADEEIPVLRPIDAEPAIVLLSPLQEIRRNVILGVLLDLSPLGHRAGSLHPRGEGPRSSWPQRPRGPRGLSKGF